MEVNTKGRVIEIKTPGAMATVAIVCKDTLKALEAAQWLVLAREAGHILEIKVGGGR